MDDFQAKFSLVYDQYIEKIYRFVYLRVNSQELAEDITSKVFLKGWESYQKTPDIKNIGGFLYQIARNSVIDYYRGKESKKTVSTNAIAQLADEGKTIHETAVLNADIEMIKLAITGIKQEYQDVVIWHYLEDMSVPEIAEILGKPEGTVRVTLHRGLSALKDALNREV